MDYFEIEGKNQLFGNIDISGAKNAVLPLMAASILNNNELTISNGRIKRKTFEGSYNARGRYLPGGRHIALIHRRKGLFHVAIQNIRNGNLKILTDTFLDESPTISPNGNIIIYATKKNQRGILAGITVNNITKFILPSIMGEVREPAWSPLVN